MSKESYIDLIGIAIEGIQPLEDADLSQLNEVRLLALQDGNETSFFDQLIEVAPEFSTPFLRRYGGNLEKHVKKMIKQARAEQRQTQLV